MLYWYVTLKNWMEEQKGQDLAEYALLLALIAVLLVAAITSVRNGIADVFADIVAALGGSGG